jgi:4-hydroxybenzoate polyprenyltransferase
MKHIFQLIRLPNLIITALTMILMRYCIIQPIFQMYYIDLELPLLLFSFIVLSVVLIAAAGYMINDYFDVKTDLVNRPNKVVIGTFIKAPTVYKAYFVLNAIAFCLSFYVSYKIGVVSMFVIFPLTMGLLWFYSTTYKRQLLTGNILVSLIVGIVPILVALYEMPLIHTRYLLYPTAYKVLLNIVIGWCGTYAAFAFVITFIRELIKDIEDFEGDMAYGRNTLPIAYGLNITKIVIAVMVLITITGLEIVFLKLLEPEKLDLITFMYFHVLLIIPLIVAVILSFMAKEQKQYTVVSWIIKIVMVLGMLYAVIVRFKMLSQIINHA